MALALAYSRAPLGVNAELVSVEVHLGNGLPQLSIAGLPETAVKESKDRVRGALVNSGFSFPARRIIINLAPADLPKDGARYDLPIAIGVLAASEQIDARTRAGYELAGELARANDTPVLVVSAHRFMLRHRVPDGATVDGPYHLADLDEVLGAIQQAC